MLRTYFGWIVPACLCLAVNAGAAAQSQVLKKGTEISTEHKSEQGFEQGKDHAGAAAGSQGLKKGPEISADRKSEQGLEHGKAYAGTREKKKDGELEGDQNEMNTAREVKADKKIKEEKSKKDKVAKQGEENFKKQKEKVKKKDKLKEKKKD